MTDTGRFTDPEQFGHDLATAFHRLTEDEPPFRTPLVEAVLAAETDGRRLRARRRAFRAGAAAVLGVAASTALVLAWPSQDRALPPPPAVVVPTEVPATVDAPLDPEAEEVALARAIARPAGGQVTMSRQYQMTVATVRTADGTFRVWVALSDNSYEAGGMQIWRDSCRDDRATCTELAVAGETGVWVRADDPERPGQERLEAATDLPNGWTVVVTVDNRVEGSAGKFVTGPTWEEVGISVAGLQQALADSPAVTHSERLAERPGRGRP